MCLAVFYKSSVSDTIWSPAVCGHNDQFLGRVQFQSIAALEPELLQAIADAPVQRPFFDS